MNLRLTPRWRRALIWGGIVFVVFTYINIFGVSAWYVLVWGRNLGGRPDPAEWEIPVPLRDLSVSTAPGRKLSYFGYEFEVPWEDLDQQKTRPVGAWQFVAFHSGTSITFYTSATNEFLDGFFGKNSVNKKNVARLFGDETIQSDYAFQLAMLDTTPGQIGLLTPRWDAVRTIFMLLFKSIDVDANSAQSGMFLLQTKDFRGFQYGNPASHPRVIEVDLFGSRNRLHFRFREKQGSAGISQPEINRVIQSVRPVQEQSPSGH